MALETDTSSFLLCVSFLLDFLLLLFALDILSGSAAEAEAEADGVCESSKAASFGRFSFFSSEKQFDKFKNKNVEKTLKNY